MARYVVHMTFEVAAQSGSYRGAGLRSGILPGRGSIRFIAGHGTLAVTAIVRAESPVDAASDVATRARVEWMRHGTGPICMVSWRAHRERAFAGLGRGRGSSGSGWPDGGPPDDGGDLAGVREPRRPNPSPGTLSATVDVPRFEGHQSAS